LLADRLDAESLSAPELAFLLTESAEALRARTSAAPGWLVALQEAFTDAHAAEAQLPLPHDVSTDHPLASCLHALGPLLRRSLGSLRRRIAALRRDSGQLPFDESVIADAFVRNIAPTILFQIAKPFVLEMHISRLRGDLRGESAQARFEQYVHEISADGFVTAFLVKYPVLARQLLVTIDQWAEYLGEFLTHLCADWQTLSSTFTLGGDARLAALDTGKGDRHRNGRSVLVLRFTSGAQLVYKPKPLAVDVHFLELLCWLNARGADPPLRSPKVIDRGEYGWSEFVTASSCASAEEVTRFYERQGGYLALLHALDAADLHNENLIAAGEHPMLVDLEALFHPHVYGVDPVLDGNVAARALDQSVWTVGLLPRRVWSDDESVGVDTSGLGGHAGQMNPHRLVSWIDLGRDDLRVGRERVELPAADNRPRLNGEDVDVLHYQDAILRGFTKMYRLLCRHRRALLTQQLPRFATDDVRVVVRPTNVYGLLWYESFHPDLLRDALDRERFFDRLWVEAAQRPYLARVIPAERRDLWRGDIPSFGTTPESRSLVTSEGAVLEEFFDEPSLDPVRRRLNELGEEDLRKQTWVIEASLATLLMDREPIARPPERPPARGAVQREELLSLATAVGERLDELAFTGDAGASWLGIGPLDESTWGVFPTGTDLYAGTAGIALFLAYLGAVTGEPSHTRLARAAVTSLRGQVRTWLQSPAADTVPIGAFEGLGAVIYVLTNLGVLWAEPELLDEATALVERLPPFIARDERLDVIYGSAGCLLCVLGLHAVRPGARSLEMAVTCGDRLLAIAQRMPRGTAWTTLDDQPPLGGFSHGTAGIALSLLRLAAASGQQRFRDTALAALEFDRSLFVPALSNWADMRILEPRTPRADDSERTSMVAWCHGAPGIGLARLAGLDVLDDRTIRGEIDTALSATVDYGFAMNHSLCHGALGNMELLLTAARRLDRPGDREALERAMAVVVGSIEANGPVTGVPLGVETPGFMTGLAGIGYELLRLAEPDKVPSVLVLAPPRWQAQP
jgi:type 2 lantibiotic biosynthesis protein LanM